MQNVAGRLQSFHRQISMKWWRKVAMSGGAALGAAAVYNALVRRHVSTLDNLIGGEEGWFKWRGHRVAYTVRGQGPPILLVHSLHAAAWSYEWRANVDALSRYHTIYTVDLLGFGRSARPATRYTAQLFLALLSDFAARVIGVPCTLAGSGLTAAYATVLGARDPGRFPSLVLIEPVGLVRLNDDSSDAADSVSRVAIGTPVFGTAVFNTLVSDRSIRQYLEEVYADNKLVTDELVHVYYEAAHQPGAKHAPAALMANQLNVDVRSSLRRLAQPALLVWGEQATVTPVEELRAFKVLKPDFEVAVLHPAGDLPHSERAEEFNQLVLDFLHRAALNVTAERPIPK